MIKKLQLFVTWSNQARYDSNILHCVILEITIWYWQQRRPSPKYYSRKFTNKLRTGTLVIQFKSLAKLLLHFSATCVGEAWGTWLGRWWHGTSTRRTGRCRLLESMAWCLCEKPRGYPPESTHPPSFHAGSTPDVSGDTWKHASGWLFMLSVLGTNGIWEPEE